MIVIRLSLFFFLLSIALAKDKKINLEDIESDNLKSERKAKQESKTITSSSYIQNKPSPQMQYGFVPMKHQPPIYQPKPTYVSQQQKQEYVTQYVQPQQQQKQQYVTQYIQPQQYYTYQPEVNLPSYAGRHQYVQQYQQYENVPYVADNNIGQQQQQYYSPQYVYVQPAASTSVQSVVDPKGAVQYVMYIPTPTYVKSQTSPYQNLVQGQEYTYVPQQEYVNYESPASEEQQQKYATILAQQPQQEEIPQQQVEYVPQQQIQQPVQSLPQKTLSDYAQQHLQSAKIPKEYAELFSHMQGLKARKQPKSLLDSYIPSHLQLQYYKQQQLQAQNERYRTYYKPQHFQQQPLADNQVQYYQQEDNSVQQTKTVQRLPSSKAKGSSKSSSKGQSHQPTYSVQVLKQ